MITNIGIENIKFQQRIAEKEKEKVRLNEEKGKLDKEIDHYKKKYKQMIDEKMHNDQASP